MEYLIRWKGFDHTFDEWLHEDQVQSPDLLRDFRAARRANSTQALPEGIDMPDDVPPPAPPIRTPIVCQTKPSPAPIERPTRKTRRPVRLE